MIDETALIEAFSKIKKEMDDLRSEIKIVSKNLNKDKSQDFLFDIEKKIEALNYFEGDLTESIKKQSDSEKEDNQKMEELSENLDLADSYY